jgi:group I intron endonuclease
MNHYVYITTNVLNDKSYVGMRSTTLDIDNDDYLGSGIVLKKAIEKHGKESFYKKILYVGQSRKDISNKEIDYIQIFNTLTPNGYNISTGGEGGNLGDEVNKRISIAGKNRAKRGNYFSKEARQKISEKLYGRKITWNDKISESMKGFKMSDETKEKISKSTSGNKNGMFGKTHSAEARKKISESRKGKPSWNHGIKTGPNSKMSETRKRLFAEGVLNVSGENNGMYGKGYIFKGIKKSEEHKQHLKDAWIKKRERKESVIPWNKGLTAKTDIRVAKYTETRLNKNKK